MLELVILKIIWIHKSLNWERIYTTQEEGWIYPKSLTVSDE